MTTNEWNDPLNGADDGWDSMAARNLRGRLAAVEAERDLERAALAGAMATAKSLAEERDKAVERSNFFEAGEARAVEALDVFARAYRVSMLPFAPGIDEADGAHHWMPHGWPSVADFKRANSVLSDSSALAWLAQQRREAAAEALEEFADDAGGIEELIRCNISDLRSALRARAAAIDAARGEA